MKYLVALVFLIVAPITFADTLSNITQYDYVGAIEQMIPSWVDMSTKLALKIFTILWSFETFNQIVFKNILGNNIKQLPIYFITRICFGGFFAFVLLKPDLYLGVIQLLASQTTNITFSADHHINGLGAGWIFEQFKNWNNDVYVPRRDALGFDQIGTAVCYAFMYLVYLGCTCFISLMIIIIEVEIYMTVFGALILTGFAGSSWTFGLWNRYLDAVIGLGVRLLVFGMLYGLLSKLILVDADHAGGLNIINSTISIILTTLCLYIIPNKIAGMVSGSATGNSLGEAVGMGIAGVATAGYVARGAMHRLGNVADVLKSKFEGNSGVAGSNSGRSDPLNLDRASTPIPKRMPAGWKAGDNG